MKQINNIQEKKKKKKDLCGDLHEVIEWQSDGLKLVNKISNRTERTKIEWHDNNLRIGKLDHDSALGVLGSLDASSRKDQLAPLMAKT
jgi:hypothetical protein